MSDNGNVIYHVLELVETQMWSPSEGQTQVRLCQPDITDNKSEFAENLLTAVTVDIHSPPGC